MQLHQSFGSVRCWFLVLVLAVWSSAATGPLAATPPVISCSPNLIVECTGGLTPVTFTTTAVDSGGSALPVTCVPPSGSGFRLGVSNVVCTATDSLGQSSSCNFTVRVVDTTPPQVRCNTNITANATSASGAIVSYIAAASDPCGIASFDCFPTAGSTFPIGATTVLCKALDGTGNSNGCTFTITVNSPANHCPVANPLSVSVDQDSQVNFQLPASDSDSDPLQYNITQAPAHGIVVLQVQTGATSYSPTAGYCGPDSFKYTASDGKCAPVEATVSIDVRCTNNQPPVCVAQIACGSTVIALNGADACVVLDASGSTDPENAPLTFRWIFDGPINLSLDASQEPGGGGTGSGHGTVALAGNSVAIDLAFSGLSANATAAHIHGPAAPGVNAAVLYPLNSIATLGATAGTIIGTVTLVEGTGGFTIAQQLQQFDAGLWYVNIHTTAHMDGEIRGQIEPTVLTGPVVTNCFDLGCHSVVLEVSDGQSLSRCETNVCVVTGCEAVEQCIELVDGAAVDRKNKRPLIASLRASCAAFGRGNLIPAFHTLEAFQHKVRAQIAPSNPAEAQAFIDCAQRILDAMNCAAGSR